MKLRKFFGLTSRSVLEQVRSELGPDAVIVANRPTPDGIEITAVAGDAMDAMLDPAPGERPQPAPSKEAAPALPPTIGPDAKAQGAPSAPIVKTPVTATAHERDDLQAAARSEPRLWQPQRVGMHAPDASVLFDEPAPMPAAAPAESSAPALADGLSSKLMDEIASMRHLIEDQFAQLAWTDEMRRAPLRARFTRDLLAAGYSTQLAREVTQRLPDDFSAAQAQQWLTGVLARNLRCAEAHDDIVTRGGVYALVGPTGVGKTTTTAKLAARCAVRYGAAKLALLTTDSYRVGAHDQLRIYAKILGVPVHTVSDRHDLRQALESTRGKHLVLIDTVGMSQRDERVREQAMLLAEPGLQRLLLLNAAAQGETLEEVVEAYRRAPEPGTDAEVAGCVLTKLDEAGQLGQALDVVIRNRLFVHYTSNGQRVPEDLYAPNASYLVHRSMKRPARTSAFALDDDALSLVTGMTAGAAHA